MTRIVLLLGTLLLAPPLLVLAQGKKSPQGAEVYFISPKDGETVTNPVTIRFGLKGMGVCPAGVFKENTGHHHLLVDVDKLPPMNASIPKDKDRLHFGGGETETAMTLAPGKHTLQLLLGDLVHVPHDPAVVSKKIVIEVK